MWLRVSLCASGSSPLARGTPGIFSLRCRADGLIPARAGNTADSQARSFSRRAHPRSRGEHLKSSRSWKPQEGSSPLARGTLLILDYQEKTLGLIPARAGNTSHHACSSAWFSGSSPLARGTLWYPVRMAPGMGLIPARAGNTSGKAPSASTDRAHPRSRGEHCDSGCRCNSEQGSSPLARGTQIFLKNPPPQLGLIPARAGNTTLCWTGRVQKWAHPRSRGEHFGLHECLKHLLGSSPLARGTLPTYL